MGSGVKIGLIFQQRFYTIPFDIAYYGFSEIAVLFERESEDVVLT